MLHMALQVRHLFVCKAWMLDPPLVRTLNLPEVNHMEQKTVALAAPAVTCVVGTKPIEDRGRLPSCPFGLEWQAAAMNIDRARSPAQAALMALLLLITSSMLQAVMLVQGGATLTGTVQAAFPAVVWEAD